MSQKWNSRVQFPQDNFVIRCTDENFGPSKSSQNPMITLEFELQSPDEIEVAGEKYTVAGEKINNVYLTTQVIEDGTLNVEKTQKCAKRIEDMYRAFNLDFSTFNPENPVLGFKGKLVHARLYGAKEEVRKSPTSEQLKAGIKQGDILLNPITKQPLLQYRIAIAEVYGLAAEETGKAY